MSARFRSLGNALTTRRASLRQQIHENEWTSRRCRRPHMLTRRHATDFDFLQMINIITNMHICRRIPENKQAGRKKTDKQWA